MASAVSEQSRAVFAKLALVVVCVGVCACGLLTVRQLRIEAAQQLAQTRLRILERDVELQRLRARIAERVTPERVEQLASGLGPLKQIQSIADERAYAAGPGGAGVKTGGQDAAAGGVKDAKKDPAKPGTKNAKDAKPGTSPPPPPGGAPAQPSRVAARGRG